MKILITGDLLPQECNMELFEQGDAETLLGKDMLELFHSVDLRVCNLEGALTDCGNAIRKSGPCIKASTGSALGISAFPIDCVSIANNHIMDYGAEGYRSTLNTLEKYGIRSVGCGDNALLARMPFIFEAEGIRIGIYSCAEYEFTIAGENYPGANAFDALYVLDDIVALKRETDYVIVLYHGGKEFYRYPAPYVQKRCRRMIEKGANLVLCQHSHCIGCREKWNEGEILYGQGNFLFHREDDAYRHTGLLATAEFGKEKWDIEYLPVIRYGKGVRLAQDQEKREILGELKKRSQEILQEGFVLDEYRAFAVTLLRQYYSVSAGRLSIIPRILYKLGFKNIYDGIYSQKNRLKLLNRLRCEAHRDIFVQGLMNGILQNNECLER